MSLSRNEMQFLSNLMYQQTGVVIDIDKYELVNARLTHVVHLKKLDSVNQLMERLHHHADKTFKNLVTEALLTNETQFFRESQVFSFVRQLIYNEFNQKQSISSDYHIWSAACSSGQEPYSLAMMLADETFVNDRKVKILASDLSQKALTKAELGLYSEFELSRGLSQAQKNEHFSHQGAQWKINDNIRRGIRFQMINLNHAWPAMPQMDMIFLRNVLIYFDLSTKLKLLARIAKRLKPNGHLIVGTGEMPDKLHSGFEQVQTGINSVYRRAAQ